jgi:membrane protein YqaA with SNARE-associated domain
LDFFDNIFLTYPVVAQWITQPGYGALFAISLLASSLVPVGSEWLLVLMLAKGYPAPATVAVATAGNCLGALTTYLAGLYGGPWLIERVFRVSKEQQERARGYYRKYGTFSLFFSWVPLIGDPLCLVGGMMGVNLWLFTLLVAAGKLVRYVVAAWVTLGSIA